MLDFCQAKDIKQGMKLLVEGEMCEVLDVVKVTDKTITVELENIGRKRWNLNTFVDLAHDLPDKVEEIQPANKQDNSHYYRLDRILAHNADYNIIFGERSNGKTYAALEYALIKFVESGYREQAAVLRRWKEDLRGKRADQIWQGLVSNNRVYEITEGRFSEIVYANGRWYLSNWNDKIQRHVPYDKPIAYAFALSEMEHDKSTSYPDITTVIFDEFLTRRYYLPDEFALFLNVLSTIIRQRDNVKIFMLGNTVNQFSPYFTEMGLKHIGQQEQGTIDLYQFSEKLTIAVEYAAATAKEKESNKYFCFDNSEAVKMIVGGAWELAIYPRLTVQFDKKDILFTYFIEFGETILQCEIVSTDTEYFTYIHEKTTPIKNPDTDLIYSLNHSEKANVKRRLMAQTSKLESKIAWFYGMEKVFYQNNQVGEVVRNFMRQTCQSIFAR